MSEDAVLVELAAACPAARPAAEADAVAGVVPRYAASPASTGQASALLRAAGRHEVAFRRRPRGRHPGCRHPRGRHPRTARLASTQFTRQG